MPDQFTDLKPGDRLPGIPSQPWNKFLGLVKGDLSGDTADHTGPTSVEVNVSNDTGIALGVYSIVGLSAPNPYANDPDDWCNLDQFSGGIPTATSPIAVLRDGVSAGDTVRARLAGRTACKVDLQDTSHLYAAPIASTDHLQSAAAGPVRIVSLQNNWTATGVQWATVILNSAAPAGGGGLRFTLAAALAATDAVQANCTIDEVWGAPAGSTVTVYNLPASSGYIFAGPAGSKGFATFDPAAGKWWMLQLECGGAGGGGGGGGFTGMIGN